MKLTSKTVILFQRKLGFKGKDQDGKVGKMTAKALKSELTQQQDKMTKKMFPLIMNGSRKRLATAYGQLLCLNCNIDPGPIDGLLGTQSTHAFEEMLFLDKYKRLPHAWRDHIHIPNPNNWPGDSQKDLIEFYGEPGKKGKDVPLKWVTLPYPHYLSWNLDVKINRMKCHEKVAVSMEKVLKEVVDSYGEKAINELGLDIWGGCFNYRKKRGGNTLSTHSWGISVDYLPNRNQLRAGWKNAVFARPDYDAWWQAWEKEGWVGLGRTQNYDWMHIQACRTPRLVLENL